MRKPRKILEDKSISTFLEKRQLTKQYKKAKQTVLSDINNKVDFKERQQKGSNIRSFRINKQFRALGTFNEK